MHDSDCGRIFALLSEYLDQELAPPQCVELEEHLRGCPECIEFVRSLKRSVKLCRQFGDCRPVHLPDADAMSRIRQAYQKMLARRGGARA